MSLQIISLLMLSVLSSSPGTGKEPQTAQRIGDLVLTLVDLEERKNEQTGSSHHKETCFHPWTGQRWKDKFASGFTNSASQSGDKLNSLIQLAIFSAQMGMIWVPVGDPPGNNWSGGSPKENNRLGSWLGLMSQSNTDQGAELAPSEGDRSTAERHGRRFAEIVRHWKREGEYRTERLVEN